MLRDTHQLNTPITLYVGTWYETQNQVTDPARYIRIGDNVVMTTH